MLETSQLTVHYGKALAVDGLTLSVGRGKCTALLGPNGAGKTTTLRAISGLTKPSSGSVHFDGKRIDSARAEAIVAMGLSHCPEGRRLAPGMTVEENLKLGAYLRRDADGIAEDQRWVFSLFPILRERLNQSAGTLSGGEQQALAIGRSLMARPRVLLLDEPSLGLAPILKQRIFASVAQIRSAGVTVLLVEQDARQALKISDEAYVLEQGSVVLSGTADELRKSSYVQDAYLGV